jgi:hypothetical protein
MIKFPDVVPVISGNSGRKPLIKFQNTYVLDVQYFVSPKQKKTLLQELMREEFLVAKEF